MVQRRQLRLIVDALDDKHQISAAKRGGEGGVGERSRHRRVTTLTLLILKAQAIPSGDSKGNAERESRFSGVQSPALLS
jgi:hypothetical protein